MGDLVKRLRSAAGCCPWRAGQPAPLLTEAAQRIEELEQDQGSSSAVEQASASAVEESQHSAGQETGWLIEAWSSRHRRFDAQWWTLDGESGGWTTDSLRALRFAREVDAQAYIDNIGWTEARPTEHAWVSR